MGSASASWQNGSVPFCPRHCSMGKENPEQFSRRRSALTASDACMIFPHFRSSSRRCPSQDEKTAAGCFPWSPRSHRHLRSMISSRHAGGVRGCAPSLVGFFLSRFFLGAQIPRTDASRGRCFGVQAASKMPHLRAILRTSSVLPSCTASMRFRANSGVTFRCGRKRPTGACVQQLGPRREEWSKPSHVAFTYAPAS